MILQIYKFNTYLLNALMLICSIWILHSSQHCLYIKYLGDIGKKNAIFQRKMEFSRIIKYNMDPFSAMKCSGKQSMRKQHNFWYASPSREAIIDENRRGSWGKLSLFNESLPGTLPKWIRHRAKSNLILYAFNCKYHWWVALLIVELEDSSVRMGKILVCPLQDKIENCPKR